MKVNGSGGAGATRTGGPARASTAAGGFSIAPQAGTSAAAPAARAGATGPIGNIGSLLALQEAEGPLERRRRAMKRGGRLLDVLDELKVAMLDGRDGGAVLGRLTQAVRESRDQTEDAGLEDVLNEIETRAAVELAKAEMSRVAA